MSLSYRENVLLKVNSSDSSRPDFAGSYTVIAYETGGRVASTDSSTTITLDSGHGFAAGDKILIRPGTDNIFSGTDTVQSTTATTIVMGQSYSVTLGDVVFNLGPDTGTSAPSYDASGVTIYSDMDGGTAISQSRVTADAAGSYSYFFNTPNIWELIRNGSGTVVGYALQLTGWLVGPSSATDNAIVRFDGTTGQLIQNYTSGAPTIGDTGAVTIPTTLGVTGKITGNDELELDGALNHDGTTVGFYGVAPTTRPTAYTQTYSTASRTHSNPTAAALTDSSGGTADQTVAAVPNPADTPASADALRDDLVANVLPVLRNNEAEFADEINKLVSDIANVKQVVNQLLDDLQSNGLLQ